MAYIKEYEYTTQLPVAQPDETSPFFQLAIDILGDSVLQERTVVLVDDEDDTDTQTFTTLEVKPNCSNYVASVSWSLFLTVTLLLFGLMRGIFNAFRGGD